LRLEDVDVQRAPLVEQRGELLVGLAFSADGTLLASAGAGGAVRLWSMPDGRLLGALPGHDRDVDAVAFGRNGVLASGGEDKTIRLWDTRTLRPVGNPITAAGSVRHVAFNPDGTLIATGGSDAVVSFWDAVTRDRGGTRSPASRTGSTTSCSVPTARRSPPAADDRLQL